MVRWACTESVPQNARRVETPNHRARTRLESVLGEDGWRVLEKARAPERRSDPDRVQRRDKTELQDGNRDRDQWRRLLIVAGTGERHGAFMPGRFGIGVDQLVPLRHGAEGEGRKKRSTEPDRQRSANRGGR